MPCDTNQLTVMHLLISFQKIVPIFFELSDFLPSFMLALNFSYFNKWINLKKSFCKCKGYFAKSLTVMLRDLGLNHVVRLLNFGCLFCLYSKFFRI